ncbi:class I tRNA ligase family protein, partial [candidate division KSB1 bacterium]|nr:class I tRNA ligase family protein [candidate division KSB1 bacterium]
MYKEFPSQLNFAELEIKILKYWDDHRIFEKSIESRDASKPFIFYEGPPTANGKPHIGHVITRAFKDVYPRFRTMQGFNAVRKAGWDTHGLPVEVEVEKQLGISGKDQIENIVEGDKEASIAKFNELCKKSVWKYVDLWEKMVKRVGHWIDLDDAYITYENDYIESVWWSLKKL